MNYVAPMAKLVNTMAEEASCSACNETTVAGQTIRISVNGGCPTHVMFDIQG